MNRKQVKPRIHQRLVSDKCCRVACHKEDIERGKCHCMNRIEDESRPTIVKPTIIGGKRCIVACDIKKVEKGLCQCANRLDEEFRSSLPKPPTEDDYLYYF